MHFPYVSPKSSNCENKETAIGNGDLISKSFGMIKELYRDQIYPTTHMFNNSKKLQNFLSRTTSPNLP
ncbi:hypothetical protein CDL15_Pgr025433 [Punica granatum]|uniref:Uncharacterized protein n=1 Tax=Punica granatum TaxID=22663 RepID=A0A218W9A9_PUNGR|nr:hypothetical protein CDL15_Pgr025433 [Punica granatum]